MAKVDIFDGEEEPMIFHGKTLTSKVSLRKVCEAIKKYGFVASPYPVIISAECHCSLGQQELIAEIMIDVFGDALVRAPPEGMPKIEELPSPNDLKGRVLLKTKNHFLSAHETLEGDSPESTEPSSSASDSEAFFDAPQSPLPPTPVSPNPGPTSPRDEVTRRNTDQMKGVFYSGISLQRELTLL